MEAITLLVAESIPEQKEIKVHLIMNMLTGVENHCDSRTPELRSKGNQKRRQILITETA